MSDIGCKCPKTARFPYLSGHGCRVAPGIDQADRSARQHLKKCRKMPSWACSGTAFKNAVAEGPHFHSRSQLKMARHPAPARHEPPLGGKRNNRRPALVYMSIEVIDRKVTA